MQERRQEKEARQKGWEELYGEERVRREGKGNWVAGDDEEEGDGQGGEVGRGGWDEDDFM